MNDPLIGTVLDSRYKLLERIGEGGMGVVYKAQHIEGAVVAVKVLNPHMARDPNWVQRFYNEAKATSQLQHKNTIRMHEFGQSPQGILYLAMEYLDGESLREVIAKGPMPPARVLDILAQCCASLHEAHERAIIHRDMKPDNIFVLKSAGRDHVKVLDFSVAKLLADRGFRTAAGMVFGTPEYMSPEQGRGRDLDARSDIYALGCIAFEMLTGKVPFTDPVNPMAILQAHMTMPPPTLPPSVPQAVQQIVVKALDKEPGRRFSSAREMQAVCESTLAQLTGQAPAAQRGGTLPPELQHVPAPQVPRGMQGAPQQAQPQQHQQQQPGRAAAQKTVMASSNQVFGQGGPPPAQQKAAAKTVFAMESPMAGGPPPAAGGPPPAVGGPPPAAGGPPPAVGGPPPATGGAAAQKTMFAGPGASAGGPPPAAGGPPPAAGGPPPAVGNPAAAQKTVFAMQGGASAAGAPPAMGGGAPQPAQGGQAKTVMASNASELLKNVQPPPMTGGPPGGNPAAPGGGKTVMLSPSEGVVSFAMGPNAAPPTQQTEGGASLAFWMICLSLGIAIGAGAYFLMILVGK